MEIEGVLTVEELAKVAQGSMMRRPAIRRARAALLGAGFLLVCGTIGLALLATNGLVSQTLPAKAQIVLLLVGLACLVFVALFPTLLRSALKRSVFKGRGSIRISYRLDGDAIVRTAEGVEQRYELGSIERVEDEAACVRIVLRDEAKLIIPSTFFANRKLRSDFVARLARR